MKFKESIKNNLRYIFEKIKNYYNKDKVLFIGIAILIILILVIIIKYFFSILPSQKSVGGSSFTIISKQTSLSIIENSSSRLVMTSKDGCRIWIYKDMNIQHSLDSIKKDFPIKIKEYTKEDIIVYIGKHTNRSLYKMLMSFPDLKYSCVILCNYENIDIAYEEVCKTYKI